MSGIYIHGMEMPKYGCDHCFLRTGNYCGRIEKDEAVVEYARKNERHPDCPLAPVPPHGRTIDADVLMELYADSDDMPLKDMKVPITVIRQNIMDMPTIIPAEDGVKTEEDSEPWLCLSCRHYPPSSTDGKPCSQCNPSEVWHSCYDPAEEGET